MQHILTGLAIALLPIGAQAASITGLPNFEKIVVYEETSGSSPVDLFASDLTRRDDALTATNRDFVFTNPEFYDAYTSDDLGNFDPNGAWITVSAVFDLPGFGGGGNINGVDLFWDGNQQRASILGSFASFGTGATPGSVGNAVDGDLATFTRLGSTTSQQVANGERLFVTVGFEATVPAMAPIPTPAAAVALISGLAGFALLRRRRPA